MVNLLRSPITFKTYVMIYMLYLSVILTYHLTYIM